MFSSPSDANQRRSERLTAEQEKSIARHIRKGEKIALDAISELEMAQEILQRKPERVERTRAGAVDRLEGAVEAVWRESKRIQG